MFMKQLCKAFLTPMTIRNLRFKHSDLPLNVLLLKKPKLILKSCETNSGLLGMCLLKTEDGIIKMTKQCVKTASDLVAEAKSKERTRKLILIFDDLSIILTQVVDLVEFIRTTHSDLVYVEKAEVALNFLSNFIYELNCDINLYDLLKKAIEKDDQMNEIELYTSKQYLSDFEQYGIHLPLEKRQYLLKLNDIIHKLCYMFLTEANGKPKYATIENVCEREKSYKQFYQFDKKRERILTNLIKQRSILAQLHSYPTYVDYKLKESFLNPVKEVETFLKKLSEKIAKFVDLDMQILQTFKRKITSHSFLEPWDVDYYKTKFLNDILPVKESEYLPYFSLGVCIEAINNLLYNLFRIKLIYEEVKQGETWFYNVYKFVVKSDSEGLLGYIYFDLYKRNGKPEISKISTLRTGKLINGKLQEPTIVIVSNWSKLTDGSLFLTQTMLEDLFFQIGQAMHSILKKPHLQYASSFLDANDITGELFKRFICNLKVMETCSRDIFTNEVLPNDILSKLYIIRHSFTASTLQKKILLAMLDYHLHKEDMSMKKCSDILKTVCTNYDIFPYNENIAFHLRCVHFVHQGGRLCTGLITEGVASCIWQKFFQKDAFSYKSGQIYKTMFLQDIGTKPTKDILTVLLGNELNAELLSDALSKEIEASYSAVLPFFEQYASYIRNR